MTGLRVVEAFPREKRPTMPKRQPAPDAPTLRVIDGDGLNADEAAWVSIASAAGAALKLPGLSACGASEMARLREASFRAAGLSPQQWSRESEADLGDYPLDVGSMDACMASRRKG